MNAQEYATRLDLVFSAFKESGIAYKEMLWEAWAKEFFPTMDLKAAIELFMDKSESNATNWWQPYVTVII